MPWPHFRIGMKTYVPVHVIQAPEGKNPVSSRFSSYHGWTKGGSERGNGLPKVTLKIQAETGLWALRSSGRLTSMSVDSRSAHWLLSASPEVCEVMGTTSPLLSLS